MTHLRIFLVAFLAFLSWSCGVAKDVVGGMAEPKRESSRTAGEVVATSKLDLVPNALGLTPGDEFRFHTEMLDVSGKASTDPAAVAWESSASDVLEAKGDGTFVAKKIGEAQVTATLGETTATATVSVQAAAACTALVVFTKLAEPVIEEKCVSCHSDNGSKAANGAFAMNPGAPDQNWQGAKTRLDAKNVAASKILRKVLGEDAHGGGAVLTASDAFFKGLQGWADAEAKCLNGEVMTAIVVSPAEATIKAGTRIRLKVEGKTAAGSMQELTKGVEWRLESDGKQATIDAASMTPDAMLTAGSKLGKISAIAKMGAFESTAIITVITLDSASTCEAAKLYDQNIDPIVQSSCISCHGQGGVAANVMTFAGPAPTAAEIALNHDELLKRLNLSKASDSLLLGKISGKVTHGGGALIAADSADFGKFSAWAAGESACFQATATGVQVSPVDPVLTAGESLQLRALVTHPDGTTSPAGQGVVWSIEPTTAGGALPAGASISTDGLVATSAAGGVAALARLGAFTAKSVLTINPVSTADVQEIKMTPASPLALPVGGFQALEIEVLYVNGSKAYNPSDAMISVMNAAIAEVDGRVVTAQAVGQTQVTVAFGGKTAELALIVSALDCPSFQSFVDNFQATVDSTCVTCHGNSANPAFAVLQLKGGSTCALRHANWVNAKTELNYTSLLTSPLLQKPLGQVTHGGGALLDGPTADKLRSWISTAGACFQSVPAQEAAALAAVCPKTPTAITLAPANPAVTVGSTLNLVATITYDDASTSTTDADLTWTSAAPAKMTVEKTASGATITGVTTGNTTVTVAVRGFSVAIPVVVQAAGVTLTSLAVDPATSSLGFGRTSAFALKGTYSDGTTKTLTTGVAWSSLDAAKATVTAAAGVVTAKAAGAVTIRVTYTDASCTVNCTADGVLTVLGIQSVLLTPATKTLTVGLTQQVTVQVKFSDNSTFAPPNTSVTWGTQSAAKATVSATGLVTGKGAGTNNITATYGGVQGTSAFTLQMPPGCSSFTTFKTPTTGVAALLEANCKSCHTGNGGGTPVFSFAPSATSCQQIASVWESAKDEVDLSSPESSNIYAKPSGAVFHTGGSGALTATQKEVFRQWAVLSASCQSAGADTLTLAELCPKQVASITLAPEFPSVTVGSTTTVVATVTYDDATTSTTDAALTWTSAAVAKFTVAKTAAGATLTGVASGTANLSIKVGTFEKIVPVVVQAAGVTLTSLAVDPATASVGLGQTKALALKGNYSDGTTKTLTTGVTWTTSDPAKATVAAGVVTAKAAGAATITAAYADASCTANCTRTSAITVVGVKTVTPAPATKALIVGQTQQMTVALIFLDNSTATLAATAATWSTSDAAKATVSAGGLVTAKAAGNATITAAYGGQTGTATFTNTMPAGCPSFDTFKATGANIATIMENTCKACHTGSGPGTSVFSFTAGATSCLQIAGVWTAAKGKVNTTSPRNSKFYEKPMNLVGHSPGKVLTDAQGNIFKAWVQASAQCQLAGVDTQTTDELCPKTPTAIAITPPTPEVRITKTLSLVATVTFDDGSTSTAVPGITWTSTVPANATVAVDGKLTGVKIGTTQVKAQLGGLSTTVNAKIIDAEITRIDVNPVSQSVPAGDSATFTVKATYSNGVTGPLTTGVTWSSTAEAIAKFPVTTSGVMTTLVKGTATARATLPSCVGVTNCPASGTLTVTDAVLRSIAVAPANSVLVAGSAARQFTVTGTYSDGTKKTVTTGVAWNSSDANSASISNTGLVNGLMQGYVTITAAMTGIASVSTDLLVIPGSDSCSTVVEYQNKVDPLFQTQCVGCHGSSVASGFMNIKPATTAFDKMANWDSVRLRINPTDVPNSKLLKKIQGGLSHTGGVQMAAGTTNFTTVETWVNHEAQCIRENIPTNLTRNSGEVLFQRMQALFPTAVSTVDTDAKPLKARHFDMFYSTGLDRVLANTERAFSPVVVVAMRNKVNAVCQDYVDEADTKNTLFTWSTNTLLAGESVPTNAVDKIVIAAARNAWLYPYVTGDAEVGHLRTLYNAAVAAPGGSALIAKKMVCVGALSSPQFWFGNKGVDDSLRRLYLETLRKIPTIADYKAYRAVAAAGRTQYLKDLITTNKNTYMMAVKSWTRDWLALRDYYDINRGQVRPEAGIGLGGGSTAMGISGVPVQELPDADTGFTRAIQLGLDRNTVSFADYSETCTKGLAQDFDPRTTEVRIEQKNPVNDTWEIVGRMVKQANGTWSSVNGQITLANGTKKATSLADVTTTQQAIDYKQCYKVGGLVGTPLECFYGDRFGQLNPNGTYSQLAGKQYMQRRMRRFSPSGEQSGYSTIKLWYSGEDAKVCNTYSRFAMTCAYRPAEQKPAMTGAIDFNTGLIPSYSATIPWNLKDGDRPKIGPPQLRDSYGSPKVLDAFRCGLPDGDEIAKLGTASYDEDLAFPLGYTPGQTTAIVQTGLNPLAANPTEFFKRNAVGLDKIIALNVAPTARPEDQAVGRLLEDLQAEPLNLVNDIVRNDKDFRLFLTAGYTVGRTELELFYRSSDYYLPAYPPGYVPKRGAANTAAYIRETDVQPIPLAWLKNSWNQGFGSAMSAAYLKDEIADDEVSAKPMSGILTQTAFLGPVSVNNGKVRSLAARVFSRLLCGLPSDFVADLSPAALTLHKSMVSTVGEGGKAHVDESRGCYSCHVNLDPMAAALKQNFKMNTDSPMQADLKYAPLLGVGFNYGVRGGRPAGNGAVFGEAVSGIKDLGATVANTRQFRECVVKTGFINTFGRQPVGEEFDLIKDVAVGFGTNYNYTDMIEQLISSDAYRRAN